MQPEEYIPPPPPPPLHTFCNLKPTMFHHSDNYLCPSKILLPPGDNGENLKATANEGNKITDDLYKLRALNGHQPPPPPPPTNAKEHDLLPMEGCQRFKNLAKRDKHDLSSLASPKRKMKSSFSWTNVFKSPTSSTLCFGEPTLRKLNQVKLFCKLSHQTLYVTQHLGSSIKKLSLVSPSTFLFMTLLLILELHSLY